MQDISQSLSSSSSSLCNSPFGRYRFLRLPFGLICAQDIFQRKVDETFGDLPGVTGIADDIVVYGYDDRDHDKNVSAVLQQDHETGLRSASSSVPVQVCKFKCASQAYRHFSRWFSF